MLRRGLRMLRRLAQGMIVLAAVALFVFAWRGDGAWFDKHVFLPQQFFIPASRGIVVWSRTAAVAIAMLLLVLAGRNSRPIVPMADSSIFVAARQRYELQEPATAGPNRRTRLDDALLSGRRA